MPAHDIAVKRVLLSVLAIALIVAVAIGGAFGLLQIWRMPVGGTPSGAAELLPALSATGPALQSAPQDDAAAFRATQTGAPAASGAAR
jgi:hypothetical protein